MDTKELRRLAQAVSGWSDCNQAWPVASEDVLAAAVGHIDESGETYPVATIDCDQYSAAHQSLPLAKFYAAANPAAISELLDRLEDLEQEKERLLGLVHDQNRELIRLREECRALRTEVESWRGLAQQFGNEADALRSALQHEADCVEAAKAEIAAMDPGACIKFYS